MGPALNPTKIARTNIHNNLTLALTLGLTLFAIFDIQYWPLATSIKHSFNSNIVHLVTTNARRLLTEWKSTKKKNIFFRLWQCLLQV